MPDNQTILKWYPSRAGVHSHGGIAADGPADLLYRVYPSRNPKLWTAQRGDTILTPEAASAVEAREIAEADAAELTWEPIPDLAEELLAKWRGNPIV